MPTAGQHGRFAVGLLGSAQVPAADPLGDTVHDLRGRCDGIGFAATRQLVTGLIGRELRREELPAGTLGGRQAYVR
jgi:hypothetical protein